MEEGKAADPGTKKRSEQGSMDLSLHEGQLEFKNSNLKRNDEGTEVLLAQHVSSPFNSDKTGENML